MLSVSVSFPSLLRMPRAPFSIVRSWSVTPPEATVTTVPVVVPSRTAGEPAGPPGQVVMVTGDEMTGWSWIVPDTSMVAPEGALVRAWLTVAQGLAFAQGPASTPPCDTYKVSAVAARAATGTKAPKASAAPSPIATYRPARPRAQEKACAFTTTAPLGCQ